MGDRRSRLGGGVRECFPRNRVPQDPRRGEQHSRANGQEKSRWPESRQAGVPPCEGVQGPVAGEMIFLSSRSPATGPWPFKNVNIGRGSDPQIGSPTGVRS